MSPFHFRIYLGLGIVLVLLGLWRFGHGRTAAGIRHAGLLLGAAILTILGASQLGIVSLDGVEECLNKRRSGRSRLVVCIFHVRRASP